MAKYIKDVVNPNRYLFYTFGLLIVVGTLLLYNPYIHFNGHKQFIDTLFMATSAVCVTGLTTVNVSDFGLVGQLIILILIQLGGLGIMYLSSTLFLLLRGQLSFKQRIMFAKYHGTYEFFNMEKVLPVILVYTFVSEFMGGFFLFFGFLFEGLSVKQSIYFSIFHSISAFCNAGLSPIDSSLIGLNNIIKVTVMSLIILGGLGFYVVYDLYIYITKRSVLRLHTKVVFITTLFLIFLGACFLLIFEKGNLNYIDALFQSITSRTAGFSTVNTGSLEVESKFLTIFLMIAGASPASTGGGIKTTTAFISFYAIYVILRGKTDFNIFKRRIPIESVLRAFSITLLYLLVCFIGTILILSIQHFSLLEAAFEVVSAMGTVGLSLGITPHLEAPAKFIIILIMFIGRIGPSSLLLMMIKRERKYKIMYPEEKILLG
ncbi:MAG: potassium transporter TrkG [Deferribacterota bacterium]|nr:potassium transporter TrkG [Deferribacterota bacterium]